MGWPSMSCALTPMVRAIGSTTPPAGNGTMMRTGLDGNSCAAPVDASAASSSATQTFIATSLEEADDLPVHEIDLVRSRRLGKARHGHDIPADEDDEFR